MRGDILAEIVTYARPSRLYRYRELLPAKLDRELRALEERYVYCASYSSMNDPMEGGHRLSSVFASSRTHKRHRLAVPQLIGRLGIASFSEIKNHETMWAHYAGSFSGLCISYSTRKLLSGLAKEFEFAKMNYSDEPPLMLKNSETASQRAKLALSYKTMRWSPEREWRLFSAQQGQAKYKDTSTVTAVYVGSRAEQRVMDEIVSRCRNLSIPVYGMEVEKYDIRFRRMDKKSIKRKK